MKKVMILGVEISDISENEALAAVRDFLADSSQHYIVTPNPEIILASSKGHKLRAILNNADLSLPDGYGLKLGAMILGEKLYNRITGADFMIKIAGLAAQEKRGVFLLGGQEGVAIKAGNKLQSIFPDIKIAGAATGGEVRKINNEWLADEPGLIEKINQSQAQILFVAFGCPKQEKWIHDNLSKLKNVKLAMTVGGSFDFLAGTARRAPIIIRQMGIEWLWRLIQNPRRFKRIWNATFGFIGKILIAKFRIAFIYRHNVVGFIINDSCHPELVSGSSILSTKIQMPKQFRHDDVEILLVQRANEKYEHWQLPQGGVDKGESEEQAVLREMREEVGATNLEILGKNPKKYKYDWSDWHQKAGSFRGQCQTIFYLRFNPSNDKIAIDEKEIKTSQWVNLNDVLKTVHSMRKPMVTIALEGYKKYDRTK